MNTANQITLARIGLIPLFILLFPIYPDWLVAHSGLLQHLNHYGIYYAALVFALASATDKLDGHIARKYNQISNLGKLLDPLADKLLISAALVLMVSQHMIPAWIAVGIIAREMVVTGIRLVASAQQIALQADRYGKLKMVAQVIAITVVLLDFRSVGFLIPIDQLLMFAAFILTVLSGYNYIKKNVHLLNA
ncbi:CDP-diacylglycerol--glycerol-3-phosphate 3-phosphatidyltransferase [Paenibacillus sp. ATY16]|uniref:CDP-diacylglycerol--glycerol-3-phosphate 3-phosphatidyltransferase n=1 Tax=Paenibacillus sp. ATY16 TaxID=1759312 RepID=UPI000E2F7282|nr:CDP-diacylglycerol--glycerol-3-phosphate 3-phosphatidyltransferase [Paenibacillus sp. ATY16]MCK9858374.1 CDP-diacylglycerol--glycerol-3-phosphate 3-phosphatidyltransferase [Paenibacillus sp. ATY16]